MGSNLQPADKRERRYLLTTVGDFGELHNAPIPWVRRCYCPYIRRAKIPLHMYAKHQYKKESEYESTVVIYILTK